MAIMWHRNLSQRKTSKSRTSQDGKFALFNCESGMVCSLSSSRLWSKLTYAIDLKDMEAATEAKSAVEDAQREMRRKMEESGQKHAPRFFQLHDGRWEPKFT